MKPNADKAEVKFTPGPWHVAHEEPSTGGVNVMSDSYFIAECICCEARDANAALIAAAPQMYEAIQRLLACMGLAGWGSDPSAEFARAAIEAAEGKKHG